MVDSIIGGDAGGYSANISQYLYHLCPGAKYTLSIYIGTTDGGLPNTPLASYVNITLDNTMLNPTITPCGKPGNECQVIVSLTPQVTGYDLYTMKDIVLISTVPRLTITVYFYNMDPNVQPLTTLVDYIKFVQQ